MTFFEEQVYGKELPAKTVCLTFDDGPATSANTLGPHSLELAEYLHSEGIAAAFFVVGKCAQRNQELLGKIVSYGHIIGNHTYNHANLLKLDDDLVLEQISKVQPLLPNNNGAGQTLFRAPYGLWSEHLAKLTNSNFNLTRALTGPVGWDVTGEDWACWTDNTSPSDCADHYLKALYSRKQANGIILAHDNTADSDWLAARNATFVMMQRLIPLLKSAGCEFMRVDQLPRLKQSAEYFEFRLAIDADDVTYTVNAAEDGTIRTQANSHSRMKDERGNASRNDDASGNGVWSIGRTESPNAITLQLKGRGYLRAESDGVKLTQASDATSFEPIAVGANRVTFRASDSGSYFGIDKSNALKLGPFDQLAVAFWYSVLNLN
jgi:peptidoglycan/xylan/chitin deacetylase (PgdA/CDA1 family)